MCPSLLRESCACCTAYSVGNTRTRMHTDGTHTHAHARTTPSPFLYAPCCAIVATLQCQQQGVVQGARTFALLLLFARGLPPLGFVGGKFWLMTFCFTAFILDLKKNNRLLRPSQVPPRSCAQVPAVLHMCTHMHTPSLQVDRTRATWSGPSTQRCLTHRRL